jgi:hypothetical protein
MDYLGEVGIGAAQRVAAPRDGAALKPLPFLRSFPWIVSNCGDIDLIGDSKPQSRFRDVVWGLSPLLTRRGSWCRMRWSRSVSRLTVLRS